ncbi:MAG: VCBS repeat-containing protein [Flavobacteriaceae bacterium]|nr:VCBS repeat-containing protein [Flavobacteriaceae bacterium]
MKYLLSTLFFIIFITGNSQNSKLFTRLASSDTGVLFNNKITDDRDKNILLYANFYGGAGVGIGDFNNDGLEDLYFAGNIVGDKLYFNQGDFKFKDVTESSGIVNDKGWSTSVIVADINNDGFLDIYVTKELYDHQPELRKNKLYINKGDGTFNEMAEKYGIANSERTRNATFLDYNKDGYLDLFILNQPPNPGSYSEYSGTKLLLPKYTSRLYQNIKGLKFKDVTDKSGLKNTSFPNAVSASDLNNDGWTDLYVTNDFYKPDCMYINNKDGTFTNIINSALNHMSYYSMGVDISDIDNDGNLDIFVLDMVAEDNFRLKSNMSGMNPSTFWNVVNNGGHYQYMFNSLQLNNGNNTFSEIAQLANIAATDWSWANLIADFDNDGKKDLFITNGLLRDIRNTDASKAVGEFVIESADTWVKENPNGGEVTIWDILDLDKALNLLPSVKLSNFAYRNNGNYNFKKVTEDWGLDQKSFSNGASYADLDNDGDLDLIVNNINEEAFIYRNNTTNNFLRIELKSKENKSVFGTRIKLIYQDEIQIFETTNVRGIYSTSESTVHFGLDNLRKVDTIIIKWPNNKKTILKDINTNQKLLVFMEEGVTIKNKESKKKQLLFSEITPNNKIPYQHIENDFDDFKHQVLLPHKMSQFGPALAVADVNNDGLEDVFIGASVGHTSQLFIQNSKGKFKLNTQVDFNKDTSKEDMDAIFFDFDNDGDNDLYVVSGGNEFSAGNGNYEDRLYLNNGKGNFSKATNVLDYSAISGSNVIPADFDNDGDIDLFVGGRLTPHQYPLPTDSKLLENKNGKLVDVTKSKAFDLINLGMVTDAVWSDFDNDGDMDLIIVGEWMSISIFENNKGIFSKLSAPSLMNSAGWWFSIEQGDFDNDGDMDFIVGNLGLNYKYKTSKEKPFDVYYKDFDNNGKNDIILGYYNYDTHYPLRGFSCSSQQIPNLKKDIKKYDIFASMDIVEVYGKSNLDEALHYEAHTFASVFIENLGNGEFKLSNLPIQVQFSSVNDILVEDFNDDGNLDVLLVGNLFVSEIETPRNDAGTGLVLLGDGKNNFKAVTNSKSGFFVRGDAKKVKSLNSTKEKLILVVNNDDLLQLFKLVKH